VEMEVNPMELYIGNLPSGTTGSDLKQLFQKASIFIPPSQRKAIKSSFAFAKFESAEDARDAFDHARDLHVHGAPVLVNFARMKTKLSDLNASLPPSKKAKLDTVGLSSKETSQLASPNKKAPNLSSSGQTPKTPKETPAANGKLKMSQLSAQKNKKSGGFQIANGGDFDMEDDDDDLDEEGLSDEDLSGSDFIDDEAEQGEEPIDHGSDSGDDEEESDDD